MTSKIEVSQFHDQTMEMKQNQTFAHGTYSNLVSYILFIKKYYSISMTFFHGTYSNLTSFFISRKILKHFQFHCKGEHKQVRGMCKSDCKLPYLQSSTLFK